MVLQDTWIKHATVKENIAFGREGASDDEIIAAAKAARAHGFIKRLKDGYDTVIGDDDLSEGERHASLHSEGDASQTSGADSR